MRAELAADNVTAPDPEADHSGIVAWVRRVGLVAETPQIRPLAGGVSSDIVEIATPTRRFCVKRALPRLKVTALWEAPVDRNAAEAAWMREVAGWIPHAVPTILAEDATGGLFAMDYLPPDSHPVWKAELLGGRTDQDFAAAVGRSLGIIHSRSAGRRDLGDRFAHDATFHAIRIEPYLLATARLHDDLSHRFELLAERTARTRRVLIHGDVSPKNILHGPNGPVFLDAECAVYGDPAFDLAFCLNHLLLKGAHRPDRRARHLDLFRALAQAYLGEIDWESPAALEERAATLLPALLLARVDGKSPVEYLDQNARAAVRETARGLMARPPATLLAIGAAWGERG